MMNSLIIDDEPPARARLSRMLTAHSSMVGVIGEARDGLEALEKISGLRPDLVFLDVEMPGLNGFQVLQSLPEDVALPLIVFTTGYDQHALAAFEANAVAYLLKPVEAERLAQVIDRAWRIHSFEAQHGAEWSDVNATVSFFFRLKKSSSSAPTAVSLELILRLRATGSTINSITSRPVCLKRCSFGRIAQ
jgi:DNA-binding LytR/AlgR family response regulator